MSNNENSHTLVEEQLHGIDQRALEHEQDTDQEWENLMQLGKFRQYLKKHPCETCVLDALLLECRKMAFVHEEIMSFLENAKKEVGSKNLGKYLNGLYEGVYEYIGTYYPNMSWDVFIKIFPKEIAKAKTIETGFKKGIKIVIANAVAKTFQQHIKECYENMANPEDQDCLCELIQTLLDYQFNYEAIGIIIGKKYGATRQLGSRCQTQMKQHYEELEKVYSSTIEKIGDKSPTTNGLA